MKIKYSPHKIFNKILIVAFVFAANATIRAQAYPNQAAVKWENYSVGDIKATFLMPKLPVRVSDRNPCRGEESFSYGSYARGAAYVVKITRKIKVPDECGKEGKPFDKTNFAERVAFLKSEPSPLQERGQAKSGSNEIVLVGNNRIYKLINDFRNERWFELMIVRPDETKPEAAKFLASLIIGKKPNGIEIGDGAPQTLGDQYDPYYFGGLQGGLQNESKTGDQESRKLPPTTGDKTDGNRNSTVTPPDDSSSKKTTAEGVMVILKPRANYTDAARRNLTQGKVVLRVTFGSHGGIGSITVVRGLPDGLTEQAIAAARRLLFIPASRNGVAFTVSKPVEYTFTIY